MKRIAYGTIAIFVFFSFLNLFHKPKIKHDQMVSLFKYDAKLEDPFFRQEKMVYPWWVVENEDGSLENTLNGNKKTNAIRRVRQTAEITSDAQYDHEIHFCKAIRQKNGGLDILIQDETASTYDDLKIVLYQDRYFCRYSTIRPAVYDNQNLVWVTITQKLTLNRNKFERGDDLEGKIEYLGEEKMAKPEKSLIPNRFIRVKGVFKTLIE